MQFDFEQTIKILGLVGGFAGFITLAWRLYDAWTAFLHIGVTVDAMKGRRVKVRTIVDNTNSIARKIDAAFLIIGPENEPVHATVINLLAEAGHSKTDFDSLNKMVETVASIVANNPERLASPGRTIVPLTYYYRENVDVADEKLSYEPTISTEDFPTGTYSVRFYVEAHPRLHRVVHAAFEVEPAIVVASPLS